MNPVFSGDGTSRLTCGLVRFTPGAVPTGTHANGQLLVCTTASGWSAPATARPSCFAPVKACGPAGEVHFRRHRQNMMCHYAISTPPAEGATTWLEPVTTRTVLGAHAR
jgi:hypothetical protein